MDLGAILGSIGALPAWVKGVAIAGVGVPVFWIVVRFLLNKFRHKVVQFVLDKGFGKLWSIVDDGIDWVRDHQDKDTAKILRQMALDVAKGQVAVAEKKLNDSD